MADEKPESTPETPPGDADAAETAEAAAPPEPHPVVVAAEAKFSTRIEVDGEDADGNPILRVGADDLIDVLTWLRDDDATRCDFLSNLTVIDWTERTPRFDVVYNLYSLRHNRFITVKTGCEEGEGVPSVCDLWGTANWHEREAYDLYGVEFLGHPGLERIFLPEDWEGFPLRKDYPLEGPNLELLTRQQAAFRGGRFDRIRGDYEMSEQERQMSSGVVGALWTPKPPVQQDPPAPKTPEGGEGGTEAGAESGGD